LLHIPIATWAAAIVKQPAHPGCSTTLCSKRPDGRRVAAPARLLRLYQAIGLQKLVRSTNFIPKSLTAMDRILPPLAPDHQNYAAPAPAIGQKQGTVAFFGGCVQDAFLSAVNRASVQGLQRNGFEVHFPPGRTCCGPAQVKHVEELLNEAYT
jgi:glycolate oxidase iron-sulfur subunit